jgi:hypothetical protein
MSDDPLDRFRCRCRRCHPHGWTADDEVSVLSVARARRRRGTRIYPATWQEMLRARLHPLTGRQLEDGERVA